MSVAKPGTMLLALAVAALAAGAAGAQAATTDIGAVGEIAAATRPSGITAGGYTVQAAQATGTYAVPAGYSTITAWSHSAGTVAGPLTFKVYRPTGVPKQYVSVASDTRTIASREVNRFPVRIAVRAGDRIGLSSDDVQLAFETSDLADRIGFFSSDPAVGTTRTTDGEPFADYKLDVAATLESDPGVIPPPPPAGPIAAGAPPPAITLLRVAPRAFRAAAGGPSVRATGSAGRATTVRFRTSADAGVRFSLERYRPGRRRAAGGSFRCVAVSASNRAATACTRRVALAGSFVRRGDGLVASFRFTGRLAGRTLRPGLYRLIATPSAGGRAGRAASRVLRITR